MAAPMNVVLGFRHTRSFICQLKSLSCIQKVISSNASSWTRFFKGSKRKEDDLDEVAQPRKLSEHDGPTTVSRLESLKKKTGLISVRGYDPPANVTERIATIAESIVGDGVTSEYKLDNRLVKFQLLTSLMREFDHVIPNTELTQMTTIKDVVTYFSTPVRDRSTYEDMAKLNLPKNLHIQLEPHRFDAETDTFFGGQTAFPDHPTIVSSLKYRRKYKGNQGESRNQRSLTNFEKEKLLEEDKEKRGQPYFISEGRKRERNYRLQEEHERPLL